MGCNVLNSKLTSFVQAFVKVSRATIIITKNALNNKVLVN